MKPLQRKRKIKKASKWKNAADPRVREGHVEQPKGIATFGGGENKIFGDPDAEDKGWGKD